MDRVIHVCKLLRRRVDVVEGIRKYLVVNHLLVISSVPICGIVEDIHVRRSAVMGTVRLVNKFAIEICSVGITNALLRVIKVYVIHVPYQHKLLVFVGMLR